MKKSSKSNIEIVKSYLAGERPFVQVGYTKAEIKRKKGDRWQDGHGVTWEQRDGYVIRVNEQANLIREVSKQICECGQNIQFGGRLDDLFYAKTGKCYECIIKEETGLRALGVWKEYEFYKMISNYLGSLKDMKRKIEDSINYFDKEGTDLSVLCNSEGFIEKFKGLNTTELLDNAKKDLVEITKTIEIVTKDKEKARAEYETALAKAKAFFAPKK